MKTIEEIRIERFRMLKDEYKTVAALASVLGKSDSQVSQWLNSSPNSESGRPRSVSSDICRQIEEACDKPRGWMDNDPAMISFLDLTALISALAGTPSEQRRVVLEIVNVLAQGLSGKVQPSTSHK